MSLRRILLTIALALLLPAIGRACPGSLALGLPLLFGTEQPATPFPATGSGTTPLVELELPAAFEESEGPPARSQLAVECLRAWRQLVREGRFEQAAPVAAKAASLDPTSLDAQHAVIVSQMLRTIGEKGCEKSCCGMVDARTAPRPTTCPLHSIALVIGGVCGESCPKATNGSAEQATKKIQIVVPVNTDRVLPGSTAAIQLISPLRHATFAKPAASATKPGEDAGAVKPANCDQSPEERALAQKALRYLFPEGLTAAQTAAQSVPSPLPLPMVECSVATRSRTTCPESLTKISGRVTVKTGTWHVECDRIVSMNDREMILEGNISMTMRDIAVQAGRVRVNLAEGTIQVDGK